MLKGMATATVVGQLPPHTGNPQWDSGVKDSAAGHCLPVWITLYSFAKQVSKAGATQIVPKGTDETAFRYLNFPGFDTINCKKKL